MGFFDKFRKKGDRPISLNAEPGSARESFILPGVPAKAASDPTLEAGRLTGKCLIASPFMDDRRFRHAVVFICGHSETGAMGVIVNHSVDEPDFTELLGQLDLEPGDDTPDITMLAGGPIDTTRGFVIHTTDYKDKGTQDITPDLRLSTSVDVLQALARNDGPERAILALGYTGWDAGQLERELGEHVWMIVDADPDLLFEVSCNHRWEAALGRLGVEVSSISHQSGRA